MQLQTNGTRRQVNFLCRARHARRVHDREEQIQLVYIQCTSPGFRAKFRREQLHFVARATLPKTKAMAYDSRQKTSRSKTIRSQRVPRFKTVAVLVKSLERRHTAMQPSGVAIAREHGRWARTLNVIHSVLPQRRNGDKI